MRIRQLFLIIVILLASIGVANATYIIQTVNLPTQSTNWASVISINKFDPNLGTLNSIKFEIDGYVSGTSRFENLGPSPSTVTTTLKAVINLKRADNSLIAQVAPAVVKVDNATGFDGTIDFGGTSGRTHSGLLGSASATKTSPPPASDLVLFTGPGTINLKVDATGSSSGSGSGNVIYWFTTFAAADVKVTYDYTPPYVVPEPSTLLLIGSGMASIFGFGWGQVRHKVRRKR